jgi:hypothetical protein
MADPQTTAELTADFVRRVITYTDEITLFSENSVGGALAKASAEQTAMGQTNYRALLRRQSLLGAQGDAAVRVAEEYGVPRLGPQRAQVLVIVRPWTTTVTAITDGKLEVDDSSHFEAGDSARIVSFDGETTELLTVHAVTTGTGPNGGDELDVGLVVGSYTPDDDTPVTLLLRQVLAEGTVFTSSAGVTFESLDSLSVGDSNPVLAGESEALGLADKVWCEASTAGAAGNIEALTVTGLQDPNDKIRSVLNPSRGFGGADEEPEFSMKYRAAHAPQRGAIETPAFLENLARRGNTKVLRAFQEDSGEISTLAVRVIKRAGGGLGSAELEALGRFMSDRLRSENTVLCRNVVLTAVEVIATVDLDPGKDTRKKRLTDAWRRAADSLATYLDYQKWPAGLEVDEAELLTIVRTTRGIAGLTTSSFQPQENVPVDVASVPTLARFVLIDATNGYTVGADLSVTF